MSLSPLCIVLGKGKSGTMYNAMPNATWKWCGCHNAQLCYGDAFKTDEGEEFLEGLGMITHCCRCHDTWRALVPHMAFFAGQSVPEFEGCLVHEMFFDQCGHADKIADDPGSCHLSHPQQHPQPAHVEPR